MTDFSIKDSCDRCGGKEDLVSSVCMNCLNKMSEIMLELARLEDEQQ